MPLRTAEIAPASPPSGRVRCLDGLRGLAACSVVAFHFFYAFVPAPFTDWNRSGFGLWDTPIAVLWNGHFAVAIFFVLSGFVLAASAPRGAREAPAMIGLRYLRLALPALVSSALAWAWLMSFPDAAREVQALTGSPWFRWTYQPPFPPFTQALWEGGIGAFLDGTTRFNNPLWTMQAEFFGSILIYGSYAVLPGRARPLAMAFAGLALGALGQFSLAAFCGGALVFEGRHILRDHARAGCVLGLFGLVLGATYPGHAADGGVVSYLQSWLGRDGVRQVGAVLVLVALLITPAARRLFETAPLQRLGELSFPLYLVHVPLIVAPACALYARFGPLDPLALAGLFVATFLAALALAGVFLVAVERPVLAGLKAVRARLRARPASA
ncbi:acyltransferase [Ancylobacter dichloromethanicus]|uniref:Acyltransferase n=1 Tax=Ancylobacter dichloromethanicus TaxID=518825 RepID=A0A9W6J9X8_9HYPH|nr:acyltransferase [Ancylobacter dichloromethanicus]MBS7556595.1 acyltransferase [Ancylobacter dichloromethanicus]GLK72546.1 acyltransferase [Ancylobacter dichloromethanicus]